MKIKLIENGHRIPLRARKYRGINRISSNSECFDCSTLLHKVGFLSMSYFYSSILTSLEKNIVTRHSTAAPKVHFLPKLN